MEYKPTYETVRIDEMIFEGSCEQAIDNDSVLPDYCADIGKVLKCTLEPRVFSQEIIGDSLKAEIATVIRVLYTDDSGKGINCFESEMTQFSEFKVKDISQQDLVQITVKTDYVNCRAVNQRKLNIHGALSVKAGVSREKEYSLITNVSGAGIELKKQSVSIGSIIGKTRQQFSISETLELGDAKPPMSCILSSDAQICCNECKAIANKLIIKGDAIIRIFYKNDIEENKTETMEFVIPYSQFIDVVGLEDNCETCLNLDIASIKLTPRADIDGEYKLLGMDMRINCSVKAYENTEVCVISDAYSTKYELDTENCTIKLEKLCRHISDTSIIKDNVDLPSEETITQINDVKCVVKDIACIFEEGKLTLKGNAVFSIIASNESCEALYAEKVSQFEYSCSAAEVEGTARENITVNVLSVGYSFAGTDKVEIRAELKIKGSILSVCELRSISSIIPDETREKSMSDYPALTVYYADEGESVWDIARSHNSSVQSIMRENDICEEVLSESKALLISI